MVGKHRDLGITRRTLRFATLMSMAADDAGLPDDPEFRSAFMAYVEWGTRLALQNSQPGAEPPPEAAVPKWGLGRGSALSTLTWASRPSTSAAGSLLLQPGVQGGRSLARPWLMREDAQTGGRDRTQRKL